MMESIVTNKINSRLLLSLTENNLKELARVIRDRVCLRKVLEEVRKVGVPVTESSSTMISAVALSSTHTQLNAAWKYQNGISILIPKLNTFSHHVWDVVTTGIVMGRAGRETTQVLHTYKTAHTISI